MHDWQLRVTGTEVPDRPSGAATASEIEPNNARDRHQERFAVAFGHRDVCLLKTIPGDKANWRQRRNAMQELLIQLTDDDHPVPSAPWSESAGTSSADAPE